MILSAVADFVSQAREMLSDKVQPYRYDDDAIVTALNSAWAEAKRIRPDILVAMRYTAPIQRVATPNNSIVPTFTTSNTTVSAQVPDIYQMAFLDFIVGWVQFRDTEDTQDSRAAQFLTMFKERMLAL